MMLAKRLEQVVEKQPKAIAIDDLAGGAISYAQLWGRIKSSSFEIERLFRNEKYVGIVADQDPRAIIACVATILSGKIIIPIDPRLETGAIKQMLKPFTNKVICEAKENFTGELEVIPLEQIAPNGEVAYSFKAQSVDAYVLHTSGTTGKPKSVLADQSALLHVAEVLARRYCVSPTSKVLQFAYLSFDSSLIEIWSTLFGGGTIIVPGKRIRENLYGCLEELLEKRQINTATLPPSVAGNISTDYLRHFETLILAGEDCPAELANRLCGRIPHLINAYGPTESIICAATYEIRVAQSGRVPIGMPLPGMQIMIDDPDNSGKGEMILASSYLAKGYANDTLQSKNYFGRDSAGKRFYKSGDIGRVRDDGNYEFLGRVDNQVKINGQRIELEGIEALIRSATGRSDIAVVTVSNKLYCFYRSTKDTLNFDNIVAQLKHKIPAYAMPQNFIPIQEIPLDRNGKIDRKTLMSNITENLDSISEPAQEQNDGFTMTSLWAEVLEIARDKIDVNSNFFSLGGDSLRALKLVKTINDKYSVNLRLSEIIADPATPNSVLEAIEKHRSKGKLS